MLDISETLVYYIEVSERQRQTTRSSIEVVITGTTGNRVYPKRVPRVQIPPAPPEKKAHPKGCAFLIPYEINVYHMD